MMFASLFATLMQVVTKPYFLLPAIIVLLFSAGTSMIANSALERPMIDFILYPDMLPSDSVFGILFTNYPFEIISIIACGILLSIVSIIAFMSISRLAMGEKFVEAINSSVADWKKAIALTIVIIFAFLIAIILISAVLALSIINPIISLILFIVALIVIIVVLVKIAFVIPALIESEAKQAIQETWKYTNKRFWKTIALVALSGVIGVVGTLILIQIGIFIGPAGELPFEILGESFGSTYFIASITNYFYAKQK